VLDCRDAVAAAKGREIVSIAEEQIITLIRDGQTTFRGLCQGLEVEPYDHRGRVVDRILQRARKAGKIRFSRALGWRLVPRLVYLSHPFGGKAENLDLAVQALAHWRKAGGFGLWLQAPWLASAWAEVMAGTTEQEWRAKDGIEVEQAVLRGYSALLLPPGRASPGQMREAEYMANTLKGRVLLGHDDDTITDNTEDWIMLPD
jgi:hypothetical protein